MMKTKFHEYDRKLERSLEILDEKPLTANNGFYVGKIVEFLQSQGITSARLLKYVEILRKLDRIVKKDFKAVSKDDLVNAVGIVQKQDISVWSKQTFRVIVKRFYKWLYDTKNYPEIVEWINTNVKRKDMPLPVEEDLITEEEIKKLIETCNYSRDKALISLLAESGARVGEIGKLRLKDVKFDKYGVILSLNGKTGRRQIRVIESTQYLLSWLESHPAKKPNTNPLWVQMNKKTPVMMTYASIRKMIGNLVERAGFEKRIYPHLFRHSRATKLANHLTEFQMNAYFGWVQGSDMPATYVHLNGKQMDDAMLNIHGLKKTEDEIEVKAKPCPRCQHINPSSVMNCIKCASFLDQKAVFEQQEFEEQKKVVEEKSNNLLNDIMKDSRVQEAIITRLRETGRLAEIVNL